MTIRRFQNHPLVNRYTASYVVAILLHLLMLLLMATPKGRFFIESTAVPAQQDPLVFEFVESEATPEAPPLETRYRSDREARSADQSQAALSRSDQAYNEGIVDIQGDYTTRLDARGEAGSEREEPKEASELAPSEASQIFKGLESIAKLNQSRSMTRAQRERSVCGAPAATQSLAARNTSSRALEEGGLQLSTYNWNFAPYLKYLKERIQSHIFPPAAFTLLGIIDGETKVRFRIYPDGRLEQLEVLDSQGSELLLKTSTQAVELSAPFKPLPDDFPEPFLEITGLFAYVLLKGGR